MAKGNRDLKIAIGLDGATQFQADLKAINTKLRTLSSQTKLTQSTMKKSTITISEYRVANQALANQMAGQRSKIELLADTVNKIRQSYEQAKIDADKFADELGESNEKTIKARQVVAQLENALNSYTTQLNNARTSLNAMQDDMNELRKKSTYAGKALKTVASVSMKATAASVKATATALKKITTAEIKALTAAVKASTKAFSYYTAAIAASSAALTALSVKTGAEYEKSMSSVKAYSTATTEEMEKLDAAAKHAGATTSKTASESADALGYMALAGWNTTEMVDGLLPMIDAAIAGNADLAATSDLVTDSMSAMSIGVQDMSGYLDVCTAAQNNSNTTINGLLEAYTECGGTLATLGVEYQESAAWLGVLANRSIKSSEAGHRFKSLMVNLIGANAKAASAMDTLGVSAWDENGKFIGLTETIKLLDSALSGCTDEQKSIFEAQIGGKTQITTLQALLSGLNNEYSELYGYTSQANGALENTASTMEDNLIGKFALLKSAAEACGISIYEGMEEPLKNTVERVADYFTQIQMAYEDGGIEEVANRFNNAFTTIETAADGSEKSVTHNSLFGDMMDDINTSMPEFIDNVGNFLTNYNDIVNKIATAFISGLPEAVGGLLPVMLNNFANSITNFEEQLPDLLTALNDGLDGVFGLIGNNLNDILNGAIDPAKFIAENIIPKAISGIVTAFTTFTNVIISSIPALVQSVAPALENAGKLLGDAIPNILNNIANILTNDAPILLESALQMVRTVAVAIGSNASSLANNFFEFIPTAIKQCTEYLPNILQAGMNILLTLLDGISKNSQAILDTSIKLILELCTTLLSEQNMTRLIESACALVSGFARGIVGNIDEISKAAGQIIGNLAMAIVNSMPELLEMGEDIVEGIIAGAFQLLNSVNLIVDSMFETTADSMASKDWSALGEAAGGAIIKGFEHAEEAKKSGKTENLKSFLDLEHEKGSNSTASTAKSTSKSYSGYNPNGGNTNYISNAKNAANIMYHSPNGSMNYINNAKDALAKMDEEIESSSTTYGDYSGETEEYTDSLENLAETIEDNDFTVDVSADTTEAEQTIADFENGIAVSNQIVNFDYDAEIGEMQKISEDIKNSLVDSKDALNVDAVAQGYIDNLDFTRLDKQLGNIVKASDLTTITPSLNEEILSEQLEQIKSAVETPLETDVDTGALQDAVTLLDNKINGIEAAVKQDDFTEFLRYNNVSGAEIQTAKSEIAGEKQSTTSDVVNAIDRMSNKINTSSEQTVEVKSVTYLYPNSQAYAESVQKAVIQNGLNTNGWGTF